MLDPLYDEIVTNTTELMVYLSRHFFIELVLPLSIFISLMLIFLVDWNWIPISQVDRLRGISLEELKRSLLD